MTCPLAVVGGGRLGGGERIGKEGGQIGGQGRLVPFDGEHHIAALRTHGRDEGGLGMQCIGGADAPLPTQLGENCLSDGNLVGLVRDAHISMRMADSTGRSPFSMARSHQPRREVRRSA